MGCVEKTSMPQGPGFYYIRNGVVKLQVREELNKIMQNLEKNLSEKTKPEVNK